MSTDYSVIREDFEKDLDAIESLVQLSSTLKSSVAPKVRVAAANSATLLLAATFEEFVRQMARLYARKRVSEARSAEQVPRKMLNRAWRSTMKELTRLDLKDRSATIVSRISDAKKEFDVVFQFCSGDLEQDIYDRVVYNEGGMKPSQINEIFSVCGLTDIMRKVSNESDVRDISSAVDAEGAHNELRNKMDGFFGRRNEIAHAIDALRSASPEQIVEDVAILRAFGRSLCVVLEHPDGQAK